MLFCLHGELIIPQKSATKWIYILILQVTRSMQANIGRNTTHSHNVVFVATCNLTEKRVKMFLPYWCFACVIQILVPLPDIITTTDTLSEISDLIIIKSYNLQQVSNFLIICLQCLWMLRLTAGTRTKLTDDVQTAAPDPSMLHMEVII